MAVFGRDREILKEEAPASFSFENGPINQKSEGSEGDTTPHLDYPLLCCLIGKENRFKRSESKGKQKDICAVKMSSGQQPNRM